MRTKLGDWVYICSNGSRIAHLCNNVHAEPTFPWYMWKVTRISRDRKYIDVRRRAAPGTWGCCALAWSWVRCADAPRLKSILNPVRNPSPKRKTETQL